MSAQSRLQNEADLSQAEVVTLVERLAQHHSAALAQLASKEAAEFRYGTGGSPTAHAFNDTIASRQHVMLLTLLLKASLAAVCGSEHSFSKRTALSIAIGNI